MEEFNLQPESRLDTRSTNEVMSEPNEVRIMSAYSALVALFQAKNCHLPKENILVWEGGKSWRLLLFTGRLGVEVLEPTRSRSRGY